MRSPAILVLAAAAAAAEIPREPPQALCATVDSFEVEHLSLLPPSPTSQWAVPLVDAASHLFSWRIRAEQGPCATDLHQTAGSRPVVARNVSQTSAVLTLKCGDSSVDCRAGAEQRVFCGDTRSLQGAGRCAVTLFVTVSSTTTVAAQPSTTTTAQSTAHGDMLLGPEDDWAGAEWIGLRSPNDTALHFRTVASLHHLGFTRKSDVAEATLFVAGLGGYRAAINGRPLDPTAVRGSVTEWGNRTFYFGDDVTIDVQAAAAAPNGLVAVTVELYKHWYALQNPFYPVAFGPRSLKAVLRVTSSNGTSVFVSPTCAGRNSGCSWEHASGSTLHDDLHTGHSIDARLALPGWEDAEYDARDKFRPAVAVDGPLGKLQPHPMQRSRVLEIARPLSVVSVHGPPPSESQNGTISAETTYQFTLPYEVAGFCTLLLPRNVPGGLRVSYRHGEAIDTATGRVVHSPCVSNFIDGCEHSFYISRGNSDGMGSHERSWRRLALSNRSSEGVDDAELEAFTPAFQYSGFKYLEVTYDADEVDEWPTNFALPPPDLSSLACYRIGAGFDWTGDVAVSSEVGLDDAGVAGTSAERFNAVVKATRATAVSNYVFDLPTDCPTREKRGWTGDSAATHRTLASFFDMRAAWTKWTDDIIYTQSLLRPIGTVPDMVPCIFSHSHGGVTSFADVAWGSALPIIASHTADLTLDQRFASRAAAAAASYVALLEKYANAATSAEPQLLNATRWPGTRHGDWWPANSSTPESVSTLLNSHHLILDIESTVSLMQQANINANTATDDNPSEAQLKRLLSIVRESFLNAYSLRMKLRSGAPGMIFHDPYPPINGSMRHGQLMLNHPPERQTETAAGMVAMDNALDTNAHQPLRAALGDAMAELVLNITSNQTATVTGGMIDTAHLGHALVKFGRPDAAYELLTADGEPSYYNMANYNGVLWEHWSGADKCKLEGGCTSTVGSLNHIMLGGSVGEAVFGIGGLRPQSSSGNASIAPVPWLVGAPLGAAVLRNTEGLVSSSWAATNMGKSEWSLWVNATVPVGSRADVKVMVPQYAQSIAVCAWECGLTAEGTGITHDSWVSFDAAYGYRRVGAVVPQQTVGAPNVSICTQLWPIQERDQLSKPSGIASVHWSNAVPGVSKFGALVLDAASGSYNVFARPC
jgi:hypothetical protein